MLRSLCVLATSLPVIAVAQNDNNFRCTQNDLVRRVEIVYETRDEVPCEVQYFKDTESPGERQVLWNARNQSGYCEARAREFITRLESVGWQCATNALDAAPEAAAPEATDEAAGAETTDDDADSGATETGQ